jgi:hypothetical protein
VALDERGDLAVVAAEQQAALDPGGNGIAVWYQRDGARYDIWANRYTAGSDWGTAEKIETDDTGSAGDPQIALDLDGNGITVWRQSDGTGARTDIWANRFE